MGSCNHVVAMFFRVESAVCIILPRAAKILILNHLLAC